MKQWLIYWIAYNSELFLILSVIFLMLAVGLIFFNLVIAGVIFLVLFVSILLLVEYCIQYVIKHSNKIKL